VSRLSDGLWRNYVSTGIRLRTRALVSAIAGLLLASGFSLLGPAPAAFAAGPQLASPASGQTVGGIPTFRWNRINGVSRYDIQISATNGFASLLVNTSTVSSSYVPPVQLPAGQLWWRVRAQNTGDSGWTTDTFTRGPLDAPTITGPVADPNGPLKQPSNPPVVTWTTVPGAQSYTLQLSPDQAFADQNLLRTYTVSATSYVVPDLQIPTTYYMRVRANFPGDYQSSWSATSGSTQYQISGLADAGLVSPTFRQTVTDVALDWKPVLGAVAYDVQIDQDQNFSSLVVNARVDGTRYSPGNELQNDSYYWRVRAVDAAGNVRGWETVPVWEFTRNWPGQPSPVYPADGATVGDPFYFQWTPSERVNGSDEDVSLSSSYRIQVSDRSNFQGNVMECATTLTTFVPSSDCHPAAAGTYWWRVLGTDDFSQGPSVTRVITAKVSRFTYAPDQVQPIAPASGAHVTTPKLAWQPVVGAAQYHVTIRNLGTGQTYEYDTPSTTLTPRTILAPGGYEWQVQTVSGNFRLGAAYIVGWPTFQVDGPPAASAAQPEPLGNPSAQRFPTLTWTPVTNATSYQVWAKPAEASGYTFVDNFAYPAGEDFTDRFLVPGDYDYFVVAFNNGVRISNGGTGHFTIQPLAAVPTAKQYAALTGTDLPDDPDQPASDLNAHDCSTQVLTADNQSECDNLRNTPVLSWAPQANAGYYLLYLAKDKDMTNGVYGNQYGAARPIEVYQPMWTPTAALPDSQANTAYYVRIVPCTYGQGCGALQSAENAFDKLSRKTVLLAPQQGRLTGTTDQVGTTVACDQGTDPANGSPVSYCANDVTLSWEDYRNSETTSYQPTTDRPFDSGTPLQAPGQTEARSYVVQVATDPGFQNVFDQAEVDQATYTAPGQTYPEAPLYWRVRAIDGNGNQLPWSDTGKFIKKSPVPVPTVPADGATVPGDIVLGWNALGTAAYYHLEVYKLGDTTASPANRVLDRTTRQRVFTLESPLPALPAGNDYVWRVQRFDASNRAGDWSSRNAAAGEKWMHFTVAKPAPSLSSPAPGATDVAPSDTVFSWGAVNGAVSYQWERLAVGGTTVLESARTPALAWAPQDSIPGGSWDWRVTAYDSNGNNLGTSPSRTFTVVDTVTAQTALTITGSGRVGEALTLDGPDWNFPANTVNTTYQWLRDGGPIGGQSALTYTVTDADRGRQISVRATGTRDGYRTGTTTSNIIVGAAGNSPVATTDVVIDGSGKVGTTLTSIPPTWDSPSVTTSYQWRVDGAGVGGATQSTYVVRPEDLGKTITLAATGTRTGYDPGTSTSGGIVAKAGDPAVATTDVDINGPNAHTGSTWTVTAPTWNVSGVSTGYQWFRDANPISGATGTSYRLTDTDIGTSVTVHALGRRTGYQDGVSISRTVSVTALDAVVGSAAPSISGVAAVRETLTADPGTWQPSSGVSFTYQWFVDGLAVAKETGGRYVVRGRDAGKSVTVRVTAAADGWAAGSATSAPVTVVLMKSTTTASTSTPTITQKQRAVINVKVDLADYGVDLGSIQVFDGNKSLAKVGLKANGDGTVTIRLKKLTKGKHKISVRYLGNAYTQPSKAKPVKIVVIKG
jgi:large repetitive protein